MADNLGKRPSKGILKNSSSFDKPEMNVVDSRPEHRRSKETKWDEMNIIATLHPADKDYGHMKIDEPKTPYNYSDQDLATSKDELDADDLAEKISKGASALPKFMNEDSTSDIDVDEDDDLTHEERERRKSFEAKRKQHYNEYYAVKLAKKKLEEEGETDESSEEENMDTEKSPSTSKSPSPTQTCSDKQTCPQSSPNKPKSSSNPK